MLVAAKYLIKFSSLNTFNCWLFFVNVNKRENSLFESAVPGVVSLWVMPCKFD